MQYDEAKQKFIQAWGTLGSAWGINKAMGQIHALLLISEEPLSTEEVMAARAAVDTVYIDENAYCTNMDWSTATNNPVLDGLSNKQIQIKGLDKSAHSSNETIMLDKIKTPPIVGVPAFLII